MRLYNLTFIDPYTLERNFTTSYNIFDTTQIFPDYDWKGQGGSVTVSRPFTEYIRGALGYRLQKMDIYNISSDAGPLITDQAGTSSTSAVSASITRNTIDDILNPSRGSTAIALVEVAGGPFGGMNKFVKEVVSYGQYIPFKWDTTFFLRGTAGNMTPYGGTTVPIFERFFVGGIQTMRGFEYGYAGPLDPESDDPVGATKELFFNSEWIFNVYKPAGLKGFFFFDYGKGFDNMSGFFRALRPAAGLGMRWYSPMGPITVVLGVNLNKQPGERAEVFDFSMGAPH
jgi:outer membrane protein insertion porin family